MDGTPTDCVNIAITQVFDGLPDLVVSGINKGCNLGDDVTYSGTVAGALEGALLGVPGVAVSLRATRGDLRLQPRRARGRGGSPRRCCGGRLPPRTFLNVNVPKGQPKGFRVTVQAKRNHVTSVAERHDPKGRSYFWIEEGQNDWQPHDRSDYQAVRGRLRVGDAAAAGPDGARRAGGVETCRSERSGAPSYRLGQRKLERNDDRSHVCRGVAQPGRALGSGPRGRRFESSRPDHFSLSRS